MGDVLFALGTFFQIFGVAHGVTPQSIGLCLMLYGFAVFWSSLRPR